MLGLPETQGGKKGKDAAADSEEESTSLGHPSSRGEWSRQKEQLAQHRERATVRSGLKELSLQRTAAPKAQRSEVHTPRGLKKSIKHLPQNSGAPRSGYYPEGPAEGREDGSRPWRSDAEWEKELLAIRRSRRGERVLRVLRIAVQEGHVKDRALFPGGSPVEFVQAEMDACATSVIVRWALPAEYEAGFMGNSQIELRNYEHSRGASAEVEQARVARALER